MRKSTTAIATVCLGVPVFSGTALASACPQSSGYWMNHDWPGDGDDPGTEENTGLEQVNQRVPGVSFATEEEGRRFLRQGKRGDKGQILAFHLITTVLNFQLTGDCYDVDTSIADVTGNGTMETFRDVKRLATDWLKESNFPDFQKTWTVPTATVQDGEVLKDLLDQFNNNNLLECDCAVDD